MHMAGHGLLHHLTLSFLPCTVFSGLRKAELGGTEMRLCVLSILISVTFLGFSSKAQSAPRLIITVQLLLCIPTLCLGVLHQMGGI